MNAYTLRDPYQTFNNYYSFEGNAYTRTPAFSYIKNNRIYSSNNKDREEIIEAGAGLGLAASTAGLATGKISALAVGAKLAATLGVAAGTGGIGLIGAAAVLGGGMLAGAVGVRTAQIGLKKGIEGLEYLGEKAFANAGKLSVVAAKILGTLAKKGLKTSLHFSQKVTSKFLEKSQSALQKSFEKPEKLVENYQINQKSEEIFLKRLNTLQRASEKGKDVKDDLKDVMQYKIPSQKTFKTLMETTATYFIKQNAQKNNGKISLKEIKKDFRKFGKAAGLSKKEIKMFESYFPIKLEKMKEELLVTKNDELKPFKVRKLAEKIAKNKNNQIQERFEKLEKGGKEAEKKQLSLEVEKTTEKENILFGR